MSHANGVPDEFSNLVNQIKETSTMARDLHQEITARIVARLRDGVCPWRQPWSGKGTASCRVTPSHRAPIAAQTLCCFGRAQRKAVSAIRVGSRSTKLANWRNRAQGRKGRNRHLCFQARQKEDDGSNRTIPFLKAYTVFNIAQCDGLPTKITDPDAAQRVVNPNTRDELADAFMSATGATIRHGEARAYYRPIDDLVNLPPFETFTNASSYYGVAFHELGHWTGAAKRLDRTFGKKFGDQAYSAEELVAELASAFLCAEFGFDNDGADAAYIAHWVRS